MMHTWMSRHDAYVEAYVDEQVCFTRGVRESVCVIICVCGSQPPVLANHPSETKG
jgi:uncharacterized protein YaeQ